MGSNKFVKERGADGGGFCGIKVSSEDSKVEGTNHWRTMYLSTLQRSRDLRQSKSRSIAPCSLSTEGIEKAKPAPLYTHLNRGPSSMPSFSETWKDAAEKLHVSEQSKRSFNNLTVNDIEGTHPNPKNMKLGNAARGTNPLDPIYKLPSYKGESPFERKFLRDSLNLNDIPGARSVEKARFSERNHMNTTDIEGTYSGWRPAHRRNFGKSTRDLCLQVRDINGPVKLYVRDPCPQPYMDIEGTHPKFLTSGRSYSSPHDFSLHTDDIQGAEACSHSWMFQVSKRKEDGKLRASKLQEQADAQDMAMNILQTKVKDQLKGKMPKEVRTSFEHMDRQQNGMLTSDEVDKAFKRLMVNLNPEEMRLISTAFGTNIHGFIDYSKLLKHVMPRNIMKHELAKKIETVVSLCLKQWADPPKPQLTEKPLMEISVGNSAIKVEGAAKDKPGNEMIIHKDDSRNEMIIHKENEMTVHKDDRQNEMKNMELSNRHELSYFSQNHSEQYLPIPLGGPFWSYTKALQTRRNPNICLSLVRDNTDSSGNKYQPLTDEEKTWCTKVGELFYTGEGNAISLGSHLHGVDWSRPSTTGSSKHKSKRENTTSSLDNTPRSGWKSLSSRSGSNLSSARAMSKGLDGPRRPFSAPASEFRRVEKSPSPRSVLRTPISSMLSCSPRSFDSTPRLRKLFGGDLCTRESYASNSEAARRLKRLETRRREDSSAVYALV